MVIDLECDLVELQGDAARHELMACAAPGVNCRRSPRYPARSKLDIDPICAF
jgi:hypothetical protein